MDRNIFRRKSFVWIPQKSVPLASHNLKIISRQRIYFWELQQKRKKTSKSVFVRPSCPKLDSTAGLKEEDVEEGEKRRRKKKKSLMTRKRVPEKGHKPNGMGTRFAPFSLSRPFGLFLGQFSKGWRGSQDLSYDLWPYTTFSDTFGSSKRSLKLFFFEAMEPKFRLSWIYLSFLDIVIIFQHLSLYLHLIEYIFLSSLFEKEKLNFRIHQNSN